MSHTVPVRIMCAIRNPDTCQLATETVTATVNTDSFSDAYAIYLREIREGVLPMRPRSELIEAALVDSLHYDDNHGTKSLLGVTERTADVINMMRPWLTPEQMKMLEDKPSRAKLAFA